MFFNSMFSFYIFIIIFILLYTSYFIYLSKINISNCERKLFYLIYFIISLITVFNPFILSLDVYRYYSYFIIFEQNNLPYIDVSYPYGPIYLIISIAIGSLSHNFMEYLILARFLNLILTIINAELIRLINIKLNNYKYNLYLLYLIFPSVFIESLLNAHIEEISTFFVLLSFYLLLNKKYIRSNLLLFVSIFIKYYSIIFSLLYIKFISKFKYKISFLLMFVSLFLIYIFIFIFDTFNIFIKSNVLKFNYIIQNSLLYFYKNDLFLYNIILLLYITSFLLIFISFIKQKYIKIFLLFQNIFFIAYGIGLILTIFYDINFKNSWWRPYEFYLFQGILILLFSLILISLLKNMIHFNKIYLILAITIQVIIVLPYLEPWYILWAIPFVFLIKNKKIILIYSLILFSYGIHYYSMDFAMCGCPQKILYTDNFQNWTIKSKINGTINIINDNSSLIFDIHSNQNGTFVVEKKLNLNFYTDQIFAYFKIKSDYNRYLMNNIKINIIFLFQNNESLKFKIDNIIDKIRYIPISLFLGNNNISLIMLEFISYFKNDFRIYISEFNIGYPQHIFYFDILSIGIIGIHIYIVFKRKKL